MEEIKVSEMLQADSIEKDNAVMIIQDGVNKKASGSIQTATGTSLSLTSVADTCKVKSNSVNLFDGKVELGTYSDTGTPSASSTNYRNVNEIKVEPETIYTFSINGTSQKYAVYYYDVSGTFISAEGLTSGTFTTPASCYFVNFRCFNADFTSDYANLKIQLEQGSTATSYNPYNTEVLVRTKNLITNIIKGYALSGNTGEITSNPQRAVSDFIKVEGGETYTRSGYTTSGLVWYKADKTRISNDNSNPVTAPANAVYVRLGINTTADYSQAQFEKGTTATTYVKGESQEISLTPQEEKLAFTYDSLTNILSDGNITIEYNTQSRLLNNDDTTAIKEYVDREIDNRKSSYASYSGTVGSLQTITGTTPTTIANMRVNINTTGKPLFVATSFFAKTANASYSALAKVYVDGVEKVGRLNTIISTSDIPYTGMVLLDNISAGNHTIEIKIAGENANSNITLPTWYTRYLNVWEIN